MSRIRRRRIATKSHEKSQKGELVSLVLFSEKGRVYYATSSDGLTWTKYDNSVPDPSDTTSTNGRVPLGQSGGDTKCVSTPCIIKDGYFYKMWYGGRDANGNFRIYHALLDALPEGLIFYSH